MTELEMNLQNRKWLFERLHAEIIGPDPANPTRATIIDETTGKVFNSWVEFRKPKLQANNQEILWQDPPTKRYGAGVLFPLGATEDRREAGEEEITVNVIDPPDSMAYEALEDRAAKDPAKTKIYADDTDNYDVTLANAYRPSAMGLSFLAELEHERRGIEISLDAAVYHPVLTTIMSGDNSETESERTMWFRTPILTSDNSKPTVYVSTNELLQSKSKLVIAVPQCEKRLEIVVVSRRFGEIAETTQRLITVSLINVQERDTGRLDELCFFQCGFRINGLSGGNFILPYPDAKRTVQNSLDERSINRLLYRDVPTYGTGHGCSAQWRNDLSMPSSIQGIGEIWTNCLPSHEVPSTSANLVDRWGKPIQVSMFKLAGLDKADDGFSEIDKLVAEYERWVLSLQELEHPVELESGVKRSSIPIGLKPTAEGLIRRCKACLERMKEGVSFLNGESVESKQALAAFKLANEVMLISQLRSSRKIRRPQWDSDGRLSWTPALPSIDMSNPDPTRGYWRAFQIAFMLISIKGICLPEHEDRHAVDLIWFPTGGGKTEAYLGLTAFTLLFNRLAGRAPGGSEVVMRYTLRMLTSQQFQRAALLFCALEHVRAKYRNLLGETEFRLGMWVGGDASPNTRADAVRFLHKLQQDPAHAENPFVLLKCPWCNAQFGPLADEQLPERKTYGGKSAQKSSTKKVYGYQESIAKFSKTRTVLFVCDDNACEFSRGKTPLPFTVIDEEIYDDPPNMLICTVDKFALIAWKPIVRCLFGIGNDGNRIGIPPTLVIQDELHLISGPLGSIVGAYETVIEYLCSTTTSGKHLTPKIIASTATVSRAMEQIQALYARKDVHVFPPQGLEAGDSFFARYERDSDGSLRPGRMYVGVLASAHGSLQTTQARVYAALLQYPAIMDSVDSVSAARDPWWTLLCFFNSLRELGGAATLLVADARDYLRVILDRHGFGYDRIRQLLNWEELTSRVRGDQIPKAIQRLETPYCWTKDGHSRETVEACLASNIIEVGIDIDRLSLMAIVGQPKTTSQYIQVSGRVGRRQNAPGMVVVTYSQSKPRDRSHYERFQSYHQRLHAHVEPTSVTPFSPPAVDRSLHALIVAFVRQQLTLKSADCPRPFPLSGATSSRKSVENMIRNRVSIVDPEEEEYTMARLARRLDEWQAWDPDSYGGFGAPPTNPTLMHVAGTPIPVEWNNHSWPTLTSLRNVDAVCSAMVTSWFNEVETQGEVK